MKPRAAGARTECRKLHWRMNQELWRTCMARTSLSAVGTPLPVRCGYSLGREGDVQAVAAERWARRFWGM